MIKICEICGAEYEPYPPRQKYQRVCGPACSRALHTRLRTEKKHSYSPEQRRASYERWLVRKGKYPLCKICGHRVIYCDPIPGTRRKQTHEACMLADCLATLNRGEKLDHKQQCRLNARGYVMADLREMLAEQEGASP